MNLAGSIYAPGRFIGVINIDKSEKHSSKNGKKNKAKHVLVACLLALFCFGIGISAHNIISIFSEDKQAVDAYNEIHNLIQEQAELNHRTTTPVETEPDVVDQGGTDAIETGIVDAVYGVTTAEKTESAEDEPVQNESNKTTVDTISGQQTDIRKRQYSMNISGIKEVYPELSAWLVAEGTTIDFPVMQAADNEYYLTHLYDGTRNANGALFIDYRNTGVFTDGNTVIYGHNMKSGSMFAKLNNYKSQEYYDTHPTMMVYTIEGDYLIELICGTVEDGNHEFVRFDFKDFEDMSAYVSTFQKRSTFVSGVELQEGDKLVSLCTCTYERNNARYMLLGRICALYEE